MIAPLPVRCLPVPFYVRRMDMFHADYIGRVDRMIRMLFF